MSFNVFRIGLIGLAAIVGGPSIAAPISWEDLKVPDRSATQQVELKGFLLPVDYEGDKVYQFMLLPWAGACSHTPPPPPDQVVLVTPDEPIRIERTYEPVSVSGTLKKDRDMSQLFILDGVAWVESGYRIRSAQVQPADLRAAPPPAGQQRNPWKFMKQ
ncbi:MAG: hypothetical protein CL534_08645 [Ahrensia sp.]|nr:hypothetical protein [Ahrensia sp.]